MTIARSRQIDLDSTPYYHLVSRCVRRACLCGYDVMDDRDYSARRDWIIERLMLLSDVFCIDLAAYALMSNHMHLVVRVDQKSALSLNDSEVVPRVSKLWKIPEIVTWHLTGYRRSEQAQAWIDERRERLYSISYLMANISEYVARKANQEDGVTGRFWEGRFKSQALLDEKALLTCMAYVDLNPMRAAIAETPEDSDYTSVKQRIEQSKSEYDPTDQRPPLMMFRDQLGFELRDDAIPMYRDDYLELIDQTGRCVRDDKRGVIPNHLAPILDRIGHDPASWQLAMRAFSLFRRRSMGSSDLMREYAASIGQRWVQGLTGAT